MAVTAGVASVEVFKFTGSPPFDVDGEVSFAQLGQAVNIDDVRQGRASSTALPAWASRQYFFNVQGEV